MAEGPVSHGRETRTLQVARFLVRHRAIVASLLLLSTAFFFYPILNTITSAAGLRLPGPLVRIDTNARDQWPDHPFIHAQDKFAAKFGSATGVYIGVVVKEGTIFCFAVSKGLLEEFGEERIRDTPLSESAFVGAGIGAALGGLRPVVEVMTVNFSLLALDQIVNTAATLCHMSGGQFPVPVVIRMATGAGRQLAAQHSHSLEAWYASVPGLRVVEPASIDDARGMLRAALASPDPVIVFEPISLYNMEGELTGAAGEVKLEGARVHRAGRDVQQRH